MTRNLTVIDGIRAAAEARPARIAITIGAEQLTYAQLIDRIDRVSSAIRTGLGLARGDRVAVVLPNCLPYLEIVCGAAAAGCPAATLPPMATDVELRVIFADCTPRALFCHSSNEAAARIAAQGIVEHIIVVDRDYDAWLAQARPSIASEPIDETDIFAIPYTSGATGTPKGVMLSHRSRVLTAYAMAAEYRELGPDSRMLVSTPLFHGAGFVNLLAPCWFGGQAVILPRFDVHELLTLIEAHRLTKAHMVPAHFAAYFALSAAERARYDTRSLRCIVSGTAPLAQVMKERIIDAFGPILHERYGSTEASIVTNLRPEDQLRKIACVGNPFPMVRVVIRDAAGQPVAPGTTGELWSRSPLMFSGYWQRPDAEKSVIADGWVSAGDLARQDDEGFTYLVDRKNDMIITGGENVYPREIEEILLRHPAVLEAAVIGLPHDYWGEAVTAHVHLRQGMNATAEELARHCGEVLARWKIPKTFTLRGPLPRNSMGKILRRQVKSEATESLR